MLCLSAISATSATSATSSESVRYGQAAGATWKRTGKWPRRVQTEAAGGALAGGALAGGALAGGALTGGALTGGALTGGALAEVAHLEVQRASAPWVKQGAACGMRIAREQPVGGASVSCTPARPSSDLGRAAGNGSSRGTFGI